SLRRALRDFLEKAAAAGPDTVAFVYVSGYGLQLEGENYFVPIDAKVARDSDVAAEALRLSDYLRPLAALKLKAGIVVLDAARSNPFVKSGPPLAGGLALVEPDPGLLIAFNAAPGAVAPDGPGPYGAYAPALERDTLAGYSEFLATYPDDLMAARIRAIVAARREAITWRRTRLVDTPAAYWSYLRRYPQGPHAADAHRRLALLAAAFEPPATFTAMAYDLAPPPPEEILYIGRPVLIFDDPLFAFAPPPSPPVVFLGPPPPDFVVLVPPPPPIGIFVLPMPIYRPVPVWVRPPAYVAP